MNQGDRVHSLTSIDRPIVRSGVDDSRWMQIAARDRQVLWRPRTPRIRLPWGCCRCARAGLFRGELVFLLPLDEKKSEGVIVLSAKTRANAIPRGMASLTFVITRVITRHTVITERHMLFWRTKNYVLFCRKHRVSLRQMALLRTLLRVDFCVVTNA